MDKEYDFVALVSLLALAFFLWTTIAVAGARARYGVPAPATAGDPAFERRFRVQMNTLEGLVLFLPSLWLFALYWNGPLAAGIGAVWLIGRVIYAIGYAQAAERRGPGFGIQALSTLVLLGGALAGVCRALLNV